MSDKKFATAVNCMDGRVQIPVIEWLKREYNVDYVDSVTEPGPNKIIAEIKSGPTIESIKNRIGISVNKHHSQLIAIVGHFDCAGNPVDKDKQLIQIFTAINAINSWGFKAEVIGLWVDENWNVTRVK
ncbi:MAG: hypothetical protein PHV06_12065 [bacterium]|nr:hypothetical protein [bacterium]